LADSYANNVVVAVVVKTCEGSETNALLAYLLMTFNCIAYLQAIYTVGLTRLKLYRVT